jgi:hypothetical protein
MLKPFADWDEEVFKAEGWVVVDVVEDVVIVVGIVEVVELVVVGVELPTQPDANVPKINNTTIIMLIRSFIFTPLPYSI